MRKKYICLLNWQIQEATAVFHFDLFRGRKKREHADLNNWICTIHTKGNASSSVARAQLWLSCVAQPQVHSSDTDTDQTQHAPECICGNILLLKPRLTLPMLFHQKHSSDLMFYTLEKKKNGVDGLHL